MPLAEIHISATQALVPLLAAFAVLVGFVGWAYGRSAGSTAVRAVGTALKVIGIAALILCLLEPLWSKERVKPGSNYFVVLADNSQGLQIHDKGAARSRGELMKKLLTDGAADWQPTLAETFQVRRYSFDARLQPVTEFGELDFNGGASALNTALKNLAERYRGQPLAGVLMFTDGNATDPGLPLDFTGLPPIYTIVSGSDDVPRDISVQKVAVSQTAFEDAPVTIQADVAANGYPNEEIVAQLIDGSGKKIEEQKQRTDKGEQTLAFRFKLKPTERGLNFYQVRALSREAQKNPTNTALAAEATLANNSRAAVVDRGRDKYRILYLAGRPNWEFKFLNRALTDDEQLELIALIRIAKREKQFEFMGRQGETSNPLFRGFGQTNEDQEQYDQPVLRRILPETADKAELIGGFPKTPEDLYRYHAIVLDDLEAAFFTRDQMMLVQKFVSERGGGLMMLGGAESFREGKFARTPIGDMLPVYLDRPEHTTPSGPVKFSLEREGLLQPWMRLRDNESDERNRISAMPGFEVLNTATSYKPGASVLASVTDAQAHKFPALVAQRFGGGRTAALLVGDVWRWGFRDEAMHKDMDKAWRQMMRWLVTDVPNRFEVHVEPKESSDTVSVQVRAREKTFQPLDNAAVQLLVSPIEGGRTNTTNTVKIKADAATEPGLYEATYITRRAGAYRVEAIVSDANGAEVGRAEAGWTSDPAAEEFRSLKPNRALLANLAKQTGGEIIAPSDLERFTKSLPSRKAPVMESAAIPLWHTPMMFLFALLCFVAEWGVRRWKGLP